jgi:opacity protein-like surface antigen
MKTTLFATAFAVAAAMCAPAFAQDLGAGSGYIGASISHTEVDVLSMQDEFETFGVHGALYTPIRDDLGAQLNFGYADADEADGSLSGSAALVTNLDGGRIAGFVGATEVADETMMAYGLQGDLHLTDITLTGGATFATIDEFDTDLWLLSGGGRYFVSDTFRIDAGVGYASGDVGGTEAEVWTGGVGAEVQFNGPLSLFGGYNRIDVRDIDAAADTVSIGVRYNFGGGTLRDRDRTGAAFGGVSDVARIAAF